MKQNHKSLFLIKNYKNNIQAEVRVSPLRV